MNDYDIWFQGMVIGNIKAANQARADRIAETRYSPGKNSAVTAIPTNIEVKVMYNRRIGKTLGGDVKNMTRALGARFQKNSADAAQLLSNACERIELAADGEGLDKITMGDIYSTASLIERGE